MTSQAGDKPPRYSRGIGRLEPIVIVAAAVLSGVIGGVSAATLGLALVGKSVEALSVEQAETLLVVGPLASLLPVSFLLLASRKDSRVARLVPSALGVWFGCGVAAFAWLGLVLARR